MTNEDFVYCADVHVWMTPSLFVFFMLRAFIWISQRSRLLFETLQ